MNPDLPLKIVAVIHSLSGGGAERVMAKLVSELARRNHRVTLVTLDEGRDDRHEVDPGVDRLMLGVMRESQGFFDRIINTAGRLRAIRRAVKRVSPDVVLSFCDQTNISVLAATRGLRTPVVVSERSDPSQQRLGRVWEFARRSMYRHAIKTIALTESAAEYLRPMCPRGVVVIASAVETPPLVSNRDMASSAKRIIAIGRLAPEKGFDRLIQAFSVATQSNREWTLQILGEGIERTSLQQLAERYELGDRVLLPGWVRPVWSELVKSTFFVLPSRYEGFPSALLEAMAAGVPSIAVDCKSGPRAIINDGENGRLVENNDAALAEGLAYMIREKERRERLGRNGQSVVDRFSWDAMVAQYEITLRDACRERSGDNKNV